MVVWLFCGILHISVEEFFNFFWQVCVIAQTRPFSIAFLSLLRGFDFGKFSKIQCGFKDLHKEKTFNITFATLLFLISIPRVQQPSTSTHTPFRSYRVSLKLKTRGSVKRLGLSFLSNMWHPATGNKK